MPITLRYAEAFNYIIGNSLSQDWSILCLDCVALRRCLQYHGRFLLIDCNPVEKDLLNTLVYSPGAFI